MAKISATIITNNNCDTIERCLRSLEGVADEIVVVDAYSTDGTADTCKSHGCKVTQREFVGYGAQKQYAVSLAANSYILSIDADEYINDELRQSIKELKEAGFKHRIYSLSRLNFFGDKPIRHSGWWPDPQIRLFDKRYASWDLRDVHERVTFPSTLWPAPVKGTLMHNRCANADEYHKKESKYASINAHVLAASGWHQSSLTTYLKAIVAFLRIYVFKLGYLDGNPGLEIAKTAASMQLLTNRLAKRD